jgi:hypothetical protein
VGAWQYSQRAIVVVHIVEKYSDGDGVWSWHAILNTPESEILMPRPCAATMGLLQIDLELIYVDFIANDCFGKSNENWYSR